MKSAIPAFFLFVTSASLLFAETRTWRDRSGERSFEAEYVSHDEENVTLKRQGEEITFAITKLHPADAAWLRKLNKEGEEVSQGSAFDSLNFGDSRETVEKKLAASKVVKSGVDSGLFGRTGLNGVYQTTQKIGGLPCYLYFGWDGTQCLKEVTLRSETVDESSYDSSVKATWSEMIDLLKTLYGKPMSAATYPSAHQLEEGAFLGSHLWRTPEGNSVLMGTGNERGKYGVVVRFTTEKIEPVVTR
ncbi:MAG: SHD1 domain-containing protein [Verrucomicrobiales bacterium]